MAEIEKILHIGAQASYDALTDRNEEYLYFTNDTFQMYKGDDLYTDGIRKVTVRPDTPAVGIIYHIVPTSGDDTLEWYDGENWNVIRYAYTDSIDAASTGEQIPTASAVYQAIEDAVNEATSGGDVVNSVVAGSDDATLVVTTGGDESTVTVPGVVVSPSYEADTRTITLPLSTGDALVITLGKDIFLDPDGENRYDPDTHEIVLTLDDGTQIRIPADDLIDVYTGGSTTTTTTTVNSENEIDVDVVLSTDENNALTIDSVNGGLLVDLSDYATVEYVDEKVQDLADDISDLEEKVETVSDAVDILNGDATTEGSIAKALEDLKEELESEITDTEGDVGEIEDQVTTNTENISDLTERVETLENALWWGEF